GPDGRGAEEVEAAACGRPSLRSACIASARSTGQANGLKSCGAIMPPQRVVLAYASSQKIRGGVSGQYTAIAHLRMSESEIGGETRAGLQTPLRSIISWVT